MPEQKGKVGRTWLLSLGIAGGIGLWIWYRDYQRTDLRMQQEALYLSYKTAHATAKIGTRCEKTIGEPVIGDRKGFVVDESDSKLHALHHEMIAARRPAVLSEVGFIAMLAHSTQRHGAYGIGTPAFSSIIDLAIIDPEKECIILRRRFENLPPDAIRVKRNNLLADVIADPPLKAVIDFLNGS